MPSINEIKSLAARKGGFAQSSQYLVKLPDIGFYNTRDLNILCKNVILPGRQILTSDRIIGVKQTKVAYGFALEALSMTFQVLNDYGVREYFELWQNKIVNNGNFNPSYKSSYARNMQILQLKKGIGLDTDLEIGPFTLDIDLFKSANVVYECTLLNAFPTTMTEIQLSNEGGLVELTVSFEYDNWKSARFYNDNNTQNLRALGTLINRVNNIVN
tara:strand:- start:400 stop:1044 length:645 start_codon:yes stop_codon:yes gene_type:complete